MVDFAAEREYLGALALFGAHRSKPLGTVEDNLRDVGVGLNVVENGGLLIQTLYSRERRTRTRLAALAFDGGHQSGFLAADERAGAETKLHVKIEAGAENIFAEQTVFTRLVDGNLQTLNRDRILCTDINTTLGSADRVAGDRHGFDQGVRVAFEDGTVHESTGVAFVGVAANILLISLVACREFPLQAGREARTASAAETGIQNGLDDLLGGHFGQHLAQSGVAVTGNVVVDFFGVDNAAVAQRHALLLCIESGFVQRLDGVLYHGLLIEQTGNDPAL